MADLATITSKIEKLLRKAGHPGTSETEAETFRAKALALMAEYRVDEADLGELDPNEEPIKEGFGTIKGTYAPLNNLIIDAVAGLYGVKTWYMSSGRPGDPTRHIMLLGFKSDIERVKQLAPLFLAEAKAGAAKTKRSTPNQTIAYRRGYINGYAAALRERIKEEKTETEAKVSASTALVIVSREQKVAEAYDDLPLIRGHGSKPVDGTGYRDGQAAGRRSNVGNERIGGSRGAIGA